ncbi:MAG: helix-turn-helix transcriptional regulator [Gemmatimonadaceae bacterium]|nr:helix-turn-helix transcriptional regulator [Chitinophagaceae bacterium]
MIRLKTGQFFGDTNQTIQLGGMTLTDTAYTHSYVDWHYHENPYFTFILSGNVTEGSHKNTHHCSAGTLLFHNWYEKHFNSKPPGSTRGFHVELTSEWFSKYDIDISELRGNIEVKDPFVRQLMYEVFKEKSISTSLDLSINSLLIQILDGLKRLSETSAFRPSWVNLVREILHDLNGQPITLTELARLANVHPVHLSRDFKKHFGCNLGVYSRRLRLLHALSIIPQSSQSLTEIAFDAGYADQSHFIRECRKFLALRPHQYRKLIS